MSPTLASLVFVAMGVLGMPGAALNRGIVSRLGKLLSRIFGDTIARFIYYSAGTFLFVVGVGRLIGNS